MPDGAIVKQKETITFCAKQFFLYDPPELEENDTLLFRRDILYLVSFKRLQGWWGQNMEDILKFIPDYKHAIGARAWGISQAPFFECVALESALEIFNEAEWNNLLIISKKLTKYLEILILRFIDKNDIKIVTPLNENERGCQLALEIIDRNNCKGLKRWLRDKGVICYISVDHGILRVAPVPLYNRFSECWDFVQILKGYFDRKHKSKL